MTSLGGFDKAAEIVEQVERGEIKAVDPPPLVNLTRLMYTALFGLTAFFLICVSAVIAFIWFCCCKNRRAKTKTS